MGKQWKQCQILFLRGTTVDGDCSHEIKRRLLLGRKTMTNLDSILKKQRHYFANKGSSSKGYGFSSSHVWMWDLDYKDWCSVQFSLSVMSESLQPQGLQHTRPPCPSSTPGVYSNSCLLSQWCHLTISSSVIPFFSHLQSLPASGFSPLSFLHQGPKYWSFSFNLSPSNEHSVLISIRVDWLYLLEVQGTLKSLLQHHSSKASVLWH